MRYTVWVCSPRNYLHSHAFAEVAEALNESLIELGHESKVVTSSIECRGRTILLGAQLLDHVPISPIFLPDDLICYNLEQIFPGSPWLSHNYVKFLKGIYENMSLTRPGHTFEVWDYSLNNIAELGKMGIEAKFMPIGYSPCLTKIENNPNPEYDVLHYGSMTERRLAIINELAAKGLNVHAAFGVYGAKRDALIANAKVILNVHHYESKVFEIVRCSYLMANAKCVVSETGSGGEEFAEGIAFAPYDSLVQHCLDLCGDGKERERIAWKGYEIFSSKSQAEYLKAVL